MIIELYVIRLSTVQSQNCPQKPDVHFFSVFVNFSYILDLLLIIVILISILLEDNVFSMTANLPYGPPMNADNDYYRTFFSNFDLL